MARADTVWNPTLKAYYDKKWSECKTLKQSVIAVANKLIRIIFSMFENNTKFSANYNSKGAIAWLDLAIKVLPTETF